VTEIQEGKDAAAALTYAANSVVSDVAESAGDAATTAVEAATDAAVTATEAATEAATDTVAAATETAAEATEAAAEAATEAAAETAEATTEAAATETSVADLLTPEGFSLDKVTVMVNGSDLDGLKKTLLVGALEKEKDNPELLKAALDQIRAALSL
jgi:hypothetical protein